MALATSSINLQPTVFLKNYYLFITSYLTLVMSRLPSGGQLFFLYTNRVTLMMLTTSEVFLVSMHVLKFFQIFFFNASRNLSKAIAS